MQTIVIGAVHRKGIAKASGNPYDFGTIYVLKPVSLRSNDKMQVQGAGLEQAEIRTSLEVVKAITALNVGFPFRATLVIDNQMGEFGTLQSVCTSCSADKPVSASRVA